MVVTINLLFNAVFLPSMPQHSHSNIFLGRDRKIYSTSQAVELVGFMRYQFDVVPVEGELEYLFYTTLKGRIYTLGTCKMFFSWRSFLERKSTPSVQLH
jgi:hypothetical protein